MPPLRSSKGDQVLALLALRRPPLDRGWLATTLWPDSTLERSRFYLRRELTHLRSALAEEAWRLQSSSRDSLSFDLDGAWVDVLEFDKLILSSDGRDSAEAIAIRSAPLLESVDEDWVYLERASREEAFVAAAQRSAERLSQDRAFDQAIPILRLAVAHEPLRESLHRMLFTALGEVNDLAALAKAYRELRSLLRRELGVEPDPETQALVRSLLEGQRPPGPRAISMPRAFQLPSLTSNLVGRERDTEDVLRLFDENRAVCLCGPGGVGKTSLALATGAILSERLQCGGAFVDLSSVTSPQGVAAAVGSALGSRQFVGHDPVETLSGLLADKSMLLVIDNCEQIADEVAKLVAKLVSRCPLVLALMTSRHALRATGIANYRLGPLSLSPSQSDCRSPATLVFLTAAARSGRVIEPTEEAVAHIDAICRRLDGLPLAIQVVASSASTLPLAHVNQMLHEAGNWLEIRGPSDESRHATVSEAISWSVGLLTDSERTLLTAASTFVGGWTLEAVTAVCAGELEASLIASGLSGLVEKSIVSFQPAQESGRYYLLEPIRDFASTMPVPPETAAGRRLRHFRYYYELTSRLGPLLYDRQSDRALQELETELHNLRLAQDYCFGQPPRQQLFAGITAQEAGMRLADRMTRFYFVRGPIEEGRELTLAALARATPDTSHSLLGMVVLSAGIYEGFLGNVVAAVEHLGRATALGRSAGDKALLGRALHNLGWSQQRHGLYDEARASFTEALAVHRQNGDPMWQALCLQYLGTLDSVLLSPETAIPLFEEALETCAGRGCRVVEGYAQAAMGSALRQLGMRDEARDAFRQSVDTLRALGNRFHLATAQTGRSRLALEEGDLDTAKALLTESLGQFVELGCRLEFAACLETWAEWHAAADQIDTAVTLLGHADRHRTELQAPHSPQSVLETERLKTRAQEVLSPARYRQTVAKGKALRQTEATALALSQGPLVNGLSHRVHKPLD